MKRLLVLAVVLGPATARADKTFNSGTGATWDCAKDGGVTINTSNGAYTLKGACKDVTVNGASVKVTIESTDDLTVNGNKNTINVGAAGEIQVNGSNNKITWKKGTSGAAPEVTTAGVGNSVTNAAPDAAAPAAPASSDVNALDCSKKKSVSITNGKGSYKLTGTCDKVAISGGSNNVEIEAAKNLAVTGSKNSVTIGKADKIATLGANNLIIYGGGLTVAKPKIAIAGKNNTITSTDDLPRTPPPGEVKTGAIAPVNTVIDCSKTPTHSIATSDGSYVFTGKCDAISVAGNGNSLRIDSVKALSLDGNNNSVDVVAVDKLSAAGNHNSARWKKGVSAAKAKVASPGNNNTILQIK